MTGYAGKILRVNLANQEVKTESLPEDLREKYIGGSGLAAKLIYDEMPAEVEPLSPEALLIFSTGPLTGTAVPSSGRLCVCARSPLGIWGESHAGGLFGQQLKKAGFDMVIVSGKAKSPTYLFINDGDITFFDAKNLWGKDVYETYNAIRNELKDNAVQIGAIGPAGEKCVNYASIIFGVGKAGRSGMGAVMGSKNLKAIAVRGTKKIRVAYESKLLDFAKEVQMQLAKSPAAQGLRKYGTGGGMESYYHMGNIPLRNHRDGVWDEEKVEKISGVKISQTILEKVTPCCNCVIGCKRTVHVKEGKYASLRADSPEFETLCMLGSNLLNDDLSLIVKMNDLCNRLGMDTISVGAVIAFAIEAYEKGIITKDDTDGLELAWKPSENLVKLVELIANRQGIGDLLAKGVAEASKKLNRESEEFAVHVKGLEVAAHNPRAFFGHAISYATMNRGGCHLAWPHNPDRGRLVPEIGITAQGDRFESKGKALTVKKMQDMMEVYDLLVVCKYASSAGLSLTQIATFFELVTGKKVSVNDLMMVGERSFNLKRILNCKWGISSLNDTLPKRLLEPQEGGTQRRVPDINLMLKEYYYARGWTLEGKPSEEKLKELGI
ncbi:MAG: aldehyde ferredoxin oxidoreductase family protein [Candidatus Bathyarchaeia archaeon]